MFYVNKLEKKITCQKYFYNYKLSNNLVLKFTKRKKNSTTNSKNK